MPWGNRKNVDPIDRFWKKVNKTGHCWLWTAKINNKGYGQYWYDRTFVCAHRFSFQIEHGYSLAPDQLILHKCDTPACVNPAHLYLGNFKDNTRDCVTRGRSPNTGRRLTEEDKQVLYEMKSNGLSDTAICNKTGCALKTVRRWLYGSFERLPIDSVTNTKQGGAVADE